MTTVVFTYQWTAVSSTLNGSKFFSIKNNISFKLGLQALDMVLLWKARNI